MISEVETPENKIEGRVEKETISLTVNHHYDQQVKKVVVDNLSIGQEIDPSNYALKDKDLVLSGKPETVVIQNEKENVVDLYYEKLVAEKIERSYDKVEINSQEKTMRAAAAPNPNDPGAVFIDKTAEWTDEDNGKAKITMTVRGNPVLQGSDVVLVLDRSGSMADNYQNANRMRLTKMKAAAKAFIDTLYQPTNGIDSDNRVSVVTFNTASQAYPNAPSGVETFLGVNDSVSGNSSTDYFNTSIDNITAINGTNYTVGFQKAQEVITNRTSINQDRPTYIVFMSDGEPNGTGGGNYYDGMVQATALKNDGTKIYSLGLGIVGTSFNTFIKPLASDPKTTYAKEISDNSDLTPIFTGIAGEIKIAGTNAVVTDTMSEHFQVDTSANPWYETNSGSATKDGSGNIEWTLGDINEAAKTLTIFIEIKDTAQTGGNLPTNTGAVVNYTDYQGDGAEKEFPIPSLPTGNIGQITMKYYFVNQAGEAVAFNGDEINNFANRIFLGSELFKDGSGSDQLALDTAYTVTPPPEITFGGITYKYVAESANHGGSPATQVVTLTNSNKTEVYNYGYKAVPNLKVTKVGVYEDTNTDGIVNVGDSINYTIEVKNPSTIFAEDVKVVDTLLGLDTSVEKILPKATWVHEQAYPITQENIDAGKALNTVIVNDDDPVEVTTPLDQTPGIKVFKKADKDKFGNVGDTITYSYEVTNTGNVTLTNINLTDNKIANLTGVETTLAPGASFTATGTYIATNADMTAGSVTNKVDVTATAGSKQLTDTDTVIVGAKQAPSYEVTKVGEYEDTNNDGKVNVGDTINYTITIKNTGNIDLTDLAVKDDMIGLDEFVSILRNDTWTHTKAYSITQEDIEAGKVLNKVIVNDDVPVEVETPLDQTPELTLVKTADKKIFTKVGETVVYKYKITNTGNVTLSQPFTLVDDKLGEIDLTSGVQELKPGEFFEINKEYTITQEDFDRGFVTNVATVTGTINEEAVKATDTETITNDTENQPKLVVEKSADKERFKNVGEVITYSYKVKNAGNVTINGPFTLEDDKIDSINMTDAPDKLAPGESFTITAEYKITKADVRRGYVKNLVLAKGKIGDEDISATDTETVKEKTKPIGPIIPIDDVEEECKDHIQYIQGYPDGSVQPEGHITRAEAATMMARLLELDIDSRSLPKYTDTKNLDAWYNRYIKAVTKEGVMEGYPDGSFRPESDITRAEFAQMISSVDKKNSSQAPFDDIKGHWGEEAINQAYANKRIDGYPDGSYKPDKPITRAESAKILNRLFDRLVRERGLGSLVEGEVNEFNDLFKSHWAYYEMVEATNNHCYFRIKDISDEIEFEEGFADGLEEVWKSVNHRYWDDINNK